MVAARHRWFAGTALAATLLVGAGAWLPTQHAKPLQKNRTQVLREAFDRASAYCYATYQDVELQGCLVGAMQAHLQALAGHDMPPGQVGMVATSRRGDI